MTIRERLAELNPSALFADGFDDALVGIVQQFNRYLALYDYEKCVDVLVKDDMSRDEAEEHMSFNVTGAWVGESTPCFLIRNEHE